MTIEGLLDNVMDKLLIERISHTGEGLGKINGKIFFVSKTLVGDVVTIKDILNYKNYAYANVDTYVKKSRPRSKVLCPYYFECGGCQLMEMPYKGQLLYKKDKVINIFKKYADLDIKPDIIYGEQYKYRNKIILHVKDGKLGLLKNKSSKIVEIDECLLVSDQVNEIIKLLKNINLTLVNKIMIREFSDGILLAFNGDIVNTDVIKTFRGKVKSIYVDGYKLTGDKFMYNKLGKYNFRISYDSFFQINRNMTEKLYEKIVKYMGKNRKNVMDLYCGTGTIGIYVSSCCENVFGIEMCRSAHYDAKMNAKINNISNIEFKNGDVSKLINSDIKYDVVIVDPPRSGLDDRTKEVMLEIGSNIIIYVSCNPITLARDVKFFSHDYELRDISLVDMFPNTYHVECICVLVRC